MAEGDTSLQAVFATGGVLDRAAPAYRYREGQVTLAQAIDDAFTQRHVLVAEAGTGVGKTFAYLVPLLRHAGKALVSTATRHLQDQLYQRDIPRIKAALGVSAQTAVLKGRANYLCLYRLEQHDGSGRFTRREEAAAFAEIVRFAAATHTGDISECASVPESAAVWSAATSTRENCLGQNCPRLNDCHVLAARKRAAEADLVVVNHHLLCADMALRDEGFGELLPTVEHIVIDEAHALADIATQFFSESVSTALVGVCARDALAAGLAHARDGASWPDLTGALERAAADLRAVLADPAGKRLRWESMEPSLRGQWEDCIGQMLSALLAIGAALQTNAERHIDLAQLHARVQDLTQRFDRFCHTDDDSPVVRWLEGTRTGLTFHVTPYDISGKFQEEMAKHQRSWIFVSATLAIGGHFTHFQERLGLTQATTLIAGSPFDFAHQGLLLVPEHGPDPKAPDLIRQLLDDPDIRALLDHVQGGVFILCTSHRSVMHAKDWCIPWAAQHPDRLLLGQGDMPRHQLIDRFRAHGRAVLVGSHSFWEGVDVPGDALALVVIDKLPFAPPDDPVLEARSQWVVRQGRDPFTTISVPEAAILLKQGVGRLIRTETDRGLVVVGDRRLADTAYGRRILRSLPGFARTRDTQAARQWLNSKT